MELLEDPLECIKKYDEDSSYREKLHFRKLHAIKENELPKLDKGRYKLYENIKEIYYIHEDNNLDTFQDSHWFIIGLLKNKNENDEKKVYFLYVTECNGTGFGLCEESDLYISQNIDLLILYGLTEEQRKSILYN